MFEVNPSAVELTLDQSGIQSIKLPKVLDGNENDTFNMDFFSLPKFVKNENNQL